MLRMIRSKVNDITNGVEKIKEFLREQRLRWFGHIKMMDDESAPVKAKDFVVDDSKADLRRDGKSL